jgi:hypothetical protein
MYNEQQHYVICKIKEMASELGRVPMKHEIQNLLPRVNLDVLFHSYDKALILAGVLKKEDIESKPEKEKKTKFKYNKSLLESFNISEVDISELFEKAGNPKVLRIVAQPDTHVQYMDKQAVRSFLKFMEWWRPDGHIIMGDFLDAEGISHWPSDSLKPREFIPEVILAKELLSEIVRVTPNCTFRAYLKGNHEDWLNQAMAAKLPALFNGLDQLGLMPDIEALLDLKTFGYDFIEMNHLLKIGKCLWTHGLYTGNGHPKKHLDVLKHNIYYGHLHDIASAQQPSMNGMIEAASIGCLCRLDAKFLKGKPNNWVHGFRTYEFFRDGNYSTYQIRIFGGLFSYNGVVFNGDEL